MTHEELEALLEVHDRWSSYDLAVAILTFGAGLVLLATGLIAAANGAPGLGVMVTLGGAGIALFGLHKEPYQAR
jgi:hypothetical protein